MKFSIYTRSSILADSLSLSTHWVYNQAKIKREFPDGVKTLHPPTSKYHGTKKAGDLTHYGDQTIWLANLLENEKYSLDSWRTTWLSKMSEYSGYCDGASKDTIANNGIEPSGSNDLAGASRIAPLLDQKLELEELVSSVRSQTLLTHGDLEIADSAEFFARAVRYVEQGNDFTTSLKLASENGTYEKLPVAEHLDKALTVSSQDIFAVSSELGLTCHIPEAFPLSLYFLIHHADNFTECISKNAMVGGDNSARAMLIAPLFAARDGELGLEQFEKLNINKENSLAKDPISYDKGSHEVKIDSSLGALAAVLEYPEGKPKAVALFAHCFTCGKDFLPEVRVSKALAKQGIATLRVDFSGIGMSEGDFAATSFLTNLENLYSASTWLTDNIASPSIIIGHSLGGAAAYAVAKKSETIKAVASIGAPADPGHVVHLFEDYLDEINENGVAEVKLAGRTFRIGKKFIDDLANYDHKECLNNLEGHKLVMHAPDDQTVPLANAGEIYSALQHPKSFVALAGSDHLLTKTKDANYAANIIAVWAERALEV